MTTTALLHRHLQQHAPRYYDHFAGQQASVTLRRSSERINSTLYEFELAVPGANHRVLVKIPFAVKLARSRRRRQTGGDRPRLFPKPSHDHKSDHEFQTLSIIEQHFKQLNDERFGAVRMLDLVPAHSALIMEKAAARSLSQHLPRVSRIHVVRKTCTMFSACYRAGAWLHLFHQFDDLRHTHARSLTRDDFLHSIERFTEYLAKHEDISFFQKMNLEIEARARDLLPEHLPLGLCHGDYAPRNVLLDRQSRVHIIDTLGRWRAPIYEDLGRFLCAMHLSVPQVWSQGWAYTPSVLSELEVHFLQGYFGDKPIPYQQIRLFECQALLDRWTSFVHTCGAASGLRRWAKSSRRWWWGRCFARHLSHTLHQLDHCPTPLTI